MVMDNSSDRLRGIDADPSVAVSDSIKTGVAPLISVVTTCFHHDQYLAECMQSVRASSMPYYDHIVVIDGPDEASVAVAEQEWREDHLGRVQIISHPENRGHATAMNTGIRHTTTEWILKVDADDWIDRYYLEAIMLTAEAHPDANVIFSPAHLFGGRDHLGREIDEVYRYPTFDPAGMADKLMIPGPAAYKRYLWEAVDGFDEALSGCEDWNWAVHAEVAIGLHPIQLDRPLWHYRQHDGPRMSKTVPLEEIKKLQARWRDLLGTKYKEI